MKNAELIGLMIANTNKTKNLRTYGNKWFSGARRISDRILTQIGKMVALIQDRIDNGQIIDGKKESLLIYNFQPLFSDNITHYVSFDMLVKPISEINNTHDLSGEPIQVVVDCTTGEVMNNAKAMLKIGIPTADAEDTQNPTSYGCYNHYRAIASFAILRFPHNDINPHDIMSGKLDKSSLVQTSIAFDSFVEARDYLAHSWDQCMIAELNYPKEEHPQKLAQGVVGRHIIKLIHPYKPQIVPANQKLVIGPKEERIDDEMRCLIEAAKEHAAKPDFGIANS